MNTKFEGWRVPPKFYSDGCTFPGILSILRGFMKAEEMKEACYLHDFLRRYAIVSASEADKILRRNLIALNLPKWKARCYWFFVKISRRWYSHTEILPVQWEEYRTPDIGE